MSIPNTTPTPNIIFNGLMREMNDTEFRIVMLVVRATLGWEADQKTGMRKIEDWISSKQLKEKTGRHSCALSRAIDRCIQKEWIEARNKNGEILDTKGKRKGNNIFFRLGKAILLSTSSESEEVIVKDQKSFLSSSESKEVLINKTSLKSEEVLVDNTSSESKEALINKTSSESTFAESELYKRNTIQKGYDEANLVPPSSPPVSVKDTKKKKVVSEENKRLHEETKVLIDYWKKKWQEGVGKEPTITSWGRYIKQAKPLIKQLGLERLKTLCDAYFITFDDKFIKENNWSLNIFLTDAIINKLNSKYN